MCFYNIFNLCKRPKTKKLLSNQKEDLIEKEKELKNIGNKTYMKIDELVETPTTVDAPTIIIDNNILDETRENKKKMNLIEIIQNNNNNSCCNSLSSGSSASSSCNSMTSLNMIVTVDSKTKDINNNNNNGNKNLKSIEINENNQKEIIKQFNKTSTISDDTVKGLIVFKF